MRGKITQPFVKLFYKLDRLDRWHCTRVAFYYYSICTNEYKTSQKSTNKNNGGISPNDLTSRSSPVISPALGPNTGKQLSERSNDSLLFEHHLCPRCACTQKLQRKFHFFCREGSEDSLFSEHLRPGEVQVIGGDEAKSFGRGREKNPVSVGRQLMGFVNFGGGGGGGGLVWGRGYFLLRQFPSLRPFLTRKFFQEILGLEGSKHFLGKIRQVHILNISDRLLRSKSFFQENIPGFICSVFRSA